MIGRPVNFIMVSALFFATANAIAQQTSAPVETAARALIEEKTRGLPGVPTMKVESLGKPIGPAPTTEVRLRPSSAPIANNGEQVQLSSLASTLQKAEAALAETPTVDRARVEEIKQAIRIMSGGNENHGTKNAWVNLSQHLFSVQPCTTPPTPRNFSASFSC